MREGLATLFGCEVCVCDEREFKGSFEELVKGRMAMSDLSNQIKWQFGSIFLCDLIYSMRLLVSRCISFCFAV